MPPKPPVLTHRRRTNPLIWCFAVVCAILAATIIIVGIIVIAGYLAIRPKFPLLYIHSARLDEADYFPGQGVLDVRLTIIVKAENHNEKTHVSFYDTKLVLGYHGLSIAQLVAGPFDVAKNTSRELNYVVGSSRIPLDLPEQRLTEMSLEKTKVMPFVLKGSSRTRWRVGPLGELKFWLHINCHMWLPTNHSAVYYSHCSTTSHYHLENGGDHIG
ncbi:hypothetical protein SSX86_006198 [Deinandra increscens subsp. villosa]|uniref:Late embryogenesis abundant protein LEA-2 subgroup domain-containing protein n=1 Tax=Deinandra increscens subsp. villosa TaxID=3103831 RepID=A0AAP0DMK0_9ASTR